MVILLPFLPLGASHVGSRGPHIKFSPMSFRGAAISKELKSTNSKWTELSTLPLGDTGRMYSHRWASDFSSEKWDVVAVGLGVVVRLKEWCCVKLLNMHQVRLRLAFFPSRTPSVYSA